MDRVIQSRLPFAPWAEDRLRRLPGTVPVEPDGWLLRDDAYAGQMRQRDALIAERPDAVHALRPAAVAAARELYDAVLPLLPKLGIEVARAHAHRPDGVAVPLRRDAPLLTLGRLVQEDLCVMLPGAGGEHVLEAAILCFPAGWLLAEKLGHPMTRIHRPVARYDGDVARRSQRLLDGVRPGRPLLRGTAHWSAAPLFDPRPEADGKSWTPPLPFIRVERQCLVRLPRTDAVAFTIHTFLVRPEALSEEQAATLAAHPIRAAG